MPTVECKFYVLVTLERTNLGPYVRDWIYRYWFPTLEQAKAFAADYAGRWYHVSVSVQEARVPVVCEVPTGETNEHAS